MSSLLALRSGVVLSRPPSSAPPPPPPPSDPGFPTLANVGHLYNGHSLSLITGDKTCAVAEPVPDKHITGKLNLAAQARISDSLIDRLVHATTSNDPLQVAYLDWVTVGPRSGHASISSDDLRRGFEFSSATVRRADVAGTVDALYIWGDYFTFDSGVIHSLYVMLSDPNQKDKGRSHSDCFQCAKGKHNSVTNSLLLGFPWLEGQAFGQWTPTTWPPSPSDYGRPGQPKATQVGILRPGNATNTIVDFEIAGNRVAAYSQGHFFLVENYDAVGGGTPHPTQVGITDNEIDPTGLPSTHKLLALGIGCTVEDWSGNVLAVDLPSIGKSAGDPISLTMATTPKSGWHTGI